MKALIGIAAVAGMLSATAAVAQYRTQISSQGAVRNHSTEVCLERGKSVAMTLGMTAHSTAVSTYMTYPGDDITTQLRCDLPQWVLIISAGPDVKRAEAQRDQVLALYNKIGGN